MDGGRPKHQLCAFRGARTRENTIIAPRAQERAKRSERSARGGGYQVKTGCVISGDKSGCKTIFVVKGDGVVNSSAPRRRRHRIVVHQPGAHSNVPGRMCPCVVLTNQLLATLQCDNFVIFLRRHQKRMCPSECATLSSDGSQGDSVLHQLS